MTSASSKPHRQRKTGKNRSTISRQIRQLEAAGMVERMPDGKFQRTVE